MKPTSCRSCGHPVITINATDIGLPAVIDPTPLTITGECLAVISGRSTFDVIAASKRYQAEVLHRLAYHIGKDRHGTLHAAHVCGHPIPTAWAAPIPPKPAANPHPEEPPF